MFEENSIKVLQLCLWLTKNDERTQSSNDGRAKLRILCRQGIQQDLRQVVPQCHQDGLNVDYPNATRER